MAYNPYFPVSYQPAYYQPQNQFLSQPQIQPQIQSPQQSSIIWISGEREAQMYPVAPNNAVTLWSQTEPVVYLKQADATGKPTLKIYDLVERNRSANTGISSSEDKAPAYATKDELSAVAGAVKGFDDAISTIKSDIDSMRADLYGIAGKKKPAKKVEAEDE